MSTLTDHSDLDWRTRQALRQEEASQREIVQLRVEICALRHEVAGLNSSIRTETSRRESEERRRRERASIRSLNYMYLMLMVIIIASMVSISLAAAYG